ncbi:5-oxoprolinase subunit PxpB [Antarcticimicrobium sediminis]|uniref:5-oxoprolinase subunit PxpB n=1 Tax=Antarcticimicrobium sediminis TaxID=2546227 RepID=A0A4V2Z803_9RHOB|nr:5-oxoprolinase subunit PxpB [Antarcticimicrobium sediminis]TDE38476.1 5-oxoprolinase subunit PxpB [Antarcticimicrobium sediminis]
MTPVFHPFGDRALTVSLGEGIDVATNDAVIDLAAALEAQPFVGMEEVVPTYRSLLVVFDPLVIGGAEVEAQVAARLTETADRPGTRRRWHVPVCYGGAVALDLDDLCAEKKLGREELIALHSGAEYRVYMIGFAPGFAYLGGLPERLHTPRLQKPRQLVPAGAIGIGGQQASVNSVAGPSGWRFIGQTPLKAFDPAREEPFLFAAGDLIRFTPVTQEEFETLSRRLAAGEVVVVPEIVVPEGRE